MNCLNIASEAQMLANRSAELAQVDVERIHT